MRVLLIIALLFATPALSQSYRAYESTTVNDDADLLPVAGEVALRTRLANLRAETGVEMTVLTLETQGDFAPDMTLEAFATGLFNHWGIGDARRNDGVLVLVIRGERAMRLELGAGYARDWDRAAERVDDSAFLPAFREGDYAGGIARGVDAIINEIVLPFRDGQPAPIREDDGGSSSPWAFGGMLVLVALVALNRQISDQLVRLRRCPQCGARTLRQSTSTDFSPTTASSGRGTRHVWCLSCGYEAVSTFIISKRWKGGSGGFGGGRSGGGGASGRW